MRILCNKPFIYVISFLICIACHKSPDPGPTAQYLVYEYYNENNPQLTPNPTSVGDKITVGQASASNVSNGVAITINGIRIQDSQNNFSVDKFYIDEKKITEPDESYRYQSEFAANNTSVKTNIASVLVLDMSTSVKPIISQLKSYAKSFINTVVNSSDNSLVAVVFFSSRSAIQTTNFYSKSNVQDLLNRIDNFTNYQERTALFEATNTGINLVNSLSFNGEKSLVVFTDGGDNDSNNPSALQSAIQQSKVNRFSIGLRGNDFNEDQLKSVASNSSQNIIADDAASLEQIFKIVGKGVISVYQLQYIRSNQILRQNEKINIKIRMDYSVIK